MLPSAPVIRIGIATLRFLPASVARGVAWLAGVLAPGFARQRGATIRQNLQQLRNERSPRVIEPLVRSTFANLLQASVDLFRLPSVGRGVLPLVEFRGKEHLEQATAFGRGVVMVTAHVGPYELGGAVLALFGYPVHAMVEEIDAETNGALAQYRGATGMRLFSRRGGTRQALKLLRDQQVVLLVADRVIGEGAEGLAVPFGRSGGLRRVPTGPASLSLASGAPVVVGHIVRRPHGERGPRYLMELGAPIIPGERSEAAVEEMTRVIAQQLSDVVTTYADQWYVFQPQWLERDRAS